MSEGFCRRRDVTKGYRDAASREPELIEEKPGSHRHVVAKLASDPEHPDVESVHPERVLEEVAPKPPNTRRVIVAFVMLLIVLVSAVVIGRAMRVPAPIKPARPPNGSAVTRSVRSHDEHDAFAPHRATENDRRGETKRRAHRLEGPFVKTRRGVPRLRERERDRHDHHARPRTHAPRCETLGHDDEEDERREHHPRDVRELAR